MGLSGNFTQIISCISQAVLTYFLRILFYNPFMERNHFSVIQRTNLNGGSSILKFLFGQKMALNLWQIIQQTSLCLFLPPTTNVIPEFLYTRHPGLQCYREPLLDRGTHHVGQRFVKLWLNYSPSSKSLLSWDVKRRRLQSPGAGIL